jgi:AcrR family transcriptional regulator
MPPSEKCAASDVIQAAIQVIEKEGIAALTARRVASEAGVSTAPVYRHFASMEGLAAAAMEGVRDQILAYTRESYTPVPFLNMGTGIALFAKDHPRLYQALFLQTDRFEELVAGFLDTLTENMKLDPRFTSLERRHRLRLLDIMWTYTHGLASLIAVGLARESSREAIVRSLQTVGQAIIRQQLELAASPSSAD